MKFLVKEEYLREEGDDYMFTYRLTSNGVDNGRFNDPVTALESVIRSLGHEVEVVFDEQGW